MISFDHDGHRFNYRVAGVAMQDHCVLLQRFPEDAFWALPGGRVHLLESSTDALKREMLEELGLIVEVKRPLWVVENFFVFRRTSYHELSFYFEMVLPEGAEAFGETTFAGRDGLVFAWAPLNALHNVALYPSFLKQRLTSIPAMLEHIVHHDSIVQTWP